MKKQRLGQQEIAAIGQRYNVGRAGQNNHVASLLGHIEAVQAEADKREAEIEGLFEKLKGDYPDPEVLRGKLSQQFCLTRDMKIFRPVVVK